MFIYHRQPFITYSETLTLSPVSIMELKQDFPVYAALALLQYLYQRLLL